MSNSTLAEAIQRDEAAAPGQILAAERTRQGLSVGDIAAKLRMSVQQVEALERSEYERLPTGTFLRGFVRSYAKLLGADSDAVLHSLEQTHSGGRRPSLVVPTQNIKISPPGERFASTKARSLLLGAIFIALAGGATYWWFNIRPEIGGATEAPPSAAKVEQPVAAPSPAAVTLPAEQKETLVITEAAPAAAAPAPAPTPVARAPAVPVGSGSLRFVFIGDSWVEVVEASGKTVISKRFKSGDNELVIGKLPVSVVIGNATVVRLAFNDVDFDLAPHTRVSVARFTLN